MSGGSSDESPQEIEDMQEGRMPTVLEELKGDNPKIFGMSYYGVIYTSSGFLAIVMAYLYMVLEDKEV